MKKILILLTFLSLILVVGCGSRVEMSDDMGNNVEIESSEESMKIESDEGDVHIEKSGDTMKVTAKDSEAEVDMDLDGDEGTVNIKSDEGDFKGDFKNTDEWCAEGSSWNYAAADGSSNMVVEGIVTSGKYEGYCHVVYEINSDDANGNMEMYFDEDGNGYQVIDMNGQKMEIAIEG